MRRTGKVTTVFMFRITTNDTPHFSYYTQFDAKLSHAVTAWTDQDCKAFI